MSDVLDALIRKGKDLEYQIAHLQTELAQLRDEIALLMGETREYHGKGVVAKKWARVRWDINKDLLLDELPRDALDFFKEVVFTREKLEQAMKAGHLPPRLYDRAVKRIQEGWNVSLKLLETPERNWEPTGEAV